MARRAQTLIQALAAEAEHLSQREQQSARRDEQIQKREAELRQRFDGLGQVRLTLEHEQTRFNMTCASWRAEMENASADLESREDILSKREQLFRRWRRKIAHSRRGDLNRFRSALDTLASARRQFVTVVEQYLIRDTDLTTERRAVVTEALALERFRLECVSMVDDAAATEKKIDRLRADESRSLTRAYEELHAQRQQLMAEADQLFEQAVVFEDQLAAAAKREGKRQNRREASAASTRGRA